MKIKEFGTWEKAECEECGDIFLVTRTMPRTMTRVVCGDCRLYEQAYNEGVSAANPSRTFQIGDRVRKVRGSNWHGKVVGFYSTKLTPEGYAVESSLEEGSVQIYPVCALEKQG